MIIDFLPFILKMLSSFFPVIGFVTIVTDWHFCGFEKYS